MRVTALLIIIGALMISQPSSIQIPVAADAGSFAAAPLAKIPSIKSIRMKGNKLIVTGEGFGDDAVVTIDFVEQRTNPDSEVPGERLIAPKAGKRIERNKILSVRVNNSPSNFSEAVYLLVTDTLWARVVRAERFTPTQTPLFLTEGDFLMLDLPDNPSSPTYIVTVDTSFFQRVMAPPFDVDSQRLYRVEESGTTSLTIEVRYAEPAPFFLRFDVFVD